MEHCDKASKDQQLFFSPLFSDDGPTCFKIVFIDEVPWWVFVEVRYKVPRGYININIDININIQIYIYTLFIYLFI